MEAIIISIGDELLIGQVQNTNASHISAELTAVGIQVRQVYTIADNKADILETLDIASNHGDVIICTGGLGPTKDDITRDALCTYFNCGIKTDTTALADITRIFAGRDLGLTELNRKQADIPSASTALRNEVGTAPGMWFSKGDKDFFFMPGVPFEMKKMLEEQIIPQLKKRAGGIHIIYRTVLTMGMGESFLSERLSEWESSLPQHIKLAWLPDAGIVKLRLTASGTDKKFLEDGISQHIEKLQKIIPELIFGYDGDTLQSIIGKLLLKRNMTVATAESCTGGRIAHLITSVPGSSAYFTGSVVAYDNAVKTGILGVQEDTIIEQGAVSEAVVMQMAEGVKQLFKTDFAVATSGIAGPSGATEGKPVGTTWIAVAGPEETIAIRVQFGDNRGRNISRASLYALNLLRKNIIKIF
ncbi:MAG: competence/damage-inducible protein A [Bacteroidota bacterium]